jgi:HEAT repeat protein
MIYFTDGIMGLSSIDNGRRTFPYIAPGLLILLAGILMFLTLPAGAAAAEAPAQVLDSNKIIQGPLKILKSPTNPLETRKTAAGIMMDLEIPEAKRQLLNIICDQSDKQARLAVIEAIADRDEPYPEFLPPLVDILLAGETDLQTAATKALGSYRNNNKLTKQLICIAGDTKRPASQRLAAIDTLGKMRSETTVEALIKFMEAAYSYPAGEQNEFETACG